MAVDAEDEGIVDLYVQSNVWQPLEVRLSTRTLATA